MRYCYILLLLAFSNAFSQDIIYKNDGTKFQSKIKEANEENIKYALYNDINGPIYTIARSQIKKILFENGSIEVFRNAPAPSSLTLEEVKEIITHKINTFVFDYKTESRSYLASFEGDYLRLVIMKSRGDRPMDEGVLFDFSQVYDFQDISYRSEEAYINVFVSFITKKQKTDKVKLVMRVRPPEEAESIVNILKIYNRMLAEKGLVPK